MPLYYFDIKNGHRLIDPSGLDCENDDDAAAKARVIAIEIARELPEGPRKIAVLNSDRLEIFSVPVHPPMAAE
jgi:hypothetical protein